MNWELQLLCRVPIPKFILVIVVITTMILELTDISLLFDMNVFFCVPNCTNIDNFLKFLLILLDKLTSDYDFWFHHHPHLRAL